MQALTYHGSHDVRVEQVPDPIIEQPDDIILRVTATAICGSDLHLYRGKIPQVKDGDIFGHEFMGVVEEVGSEVTAVSKGDRVIVPFVIACGGCFFCQMDLHAACETTNPGRGAILNKKQIPSGLPCSATATSMAGCRVVRPSWFVCPKPMPGHSRCRMCWTTSRCCF